MKHFGIATLSLWAAAIAAFSPRAGAAVELPRGGLFVNAHAEAAYTSNLFLTADEESDFVFVILPAVEYLLAEGVIHFEARAGVEFLRFADWSRFDAENFKSDFLLGFPHEERGRRFFFRLRGGFDEITSATAVDGALLREDRFRVGGNLDYFVSERGSLRLGADYLDRNARTEGFASRRMTTVRFGPALEYSERLTLTASARYRRTKVSGADPALDSDDYAVLAGAEGRLLARLVGELEAGVQRREFDGGFDSQTEPYAAAGLTWEVDERTEVVLSLSNDMQTSASNLSGRTFLATLEGVRRVGERTRINLGAGFEDSNYLRAAGNRRHDDEWSAFGGVAYRFNRYLSTRWDVAYAHRNSDFAAANYDAVRTGVSVDARF